MVVFAHIGHHDVSHWTGIVHVLLHVGMVLTCGVTPLSMIFLMLKDSMRRKK